MSELLMSKQLDDRSVIACAASTSDKSWFHIQMVRRRQDLEHVVRQVRVLSLALRHPRVPWYGKLVAGCSVGYLVSPVQIIPTFIPIIGQLDDLFVLFVGMKLLRKVTPSSVLAECEVRAQSPIFCGRKCAANELAALAERPGDIPAG
jgi:uncharacterized membrane protein YkvA (DUF1232 family)